MSALCVALMAIARVISVTDYAISAICGLIIGAVVIELGYKWALAAYVVSSLLGIFVGANEAAVTFVALLGYYPIIKPFIERLNKFIAYLIKFVLFNGIMCTLYFALDKLELIPMEEIPWLGDYTVLVVLVLADVAFFLYDFAFGGIMALYYSRLHSRISRIIRK